jgi:hypothetical protein
MVAAIPAFIGCPGIVALAGQARGLDEQQDALLHTLHLVPSKRRKLSGNSGIAGSERGEHAALDHQHLHVGDCLGRQGVLVGELEPENVARQVKSSDLAATVAQNLVGSHRAADHLVKVLGQLVLAVNFCIARIGYGGAP